MSNWCVWVTECDGMRHFTVPTVELHQGNYSKRDSVRDPNTLPFLCIINSELWHGKWSFSHLCTFTHASRNKAVWTEIKFHKGPPSLSASYWINACVMTAVMRNEVPVGEIWLIQSFDGGKSSLSHFLHSFMWRGIAVLTWLTFMNTIFLNHITRNWYLQVCIQRFIRLLCGLIASISISKEAN